MLEKTIISVSVKAEKTIAIIRHTVIKQQCLMQQKKKTSNLIS